jgi:hypothetical protein
MNETAAETLPGKEPNQKSSSQIPVPVVLAPNPKDSPRSTASKQKEWKERRTHSFEEIPDVKIPPPPAPNRTDVKIENSSVNKELIEFKQRLERIKKKRAQKRNQYVQLNTSLLGANGGKDSSEIITIQPQTIEQASSKSDKSSEKPKIVRTLSLKTAEESIPSKNNSSSSTSEESPPPTPKWKLKRLICSSRKVTHAEFKFKSPLEDLDLSGLEDCIKISFGSRISTGEAHPHRIGNSSSAQFGIEPPEQTPSRLVVESSEMVDIHSEEVGPRRRIVRSMSEGHTEFVDNGGMGSQPCIPTRLSIREKWYIRPTVSFSEVEPTHQIMYV